MHVWFITCPDNYQVKFKQACQSVCQVPIQLIFKEGTQLKCQRNVQVPIQVPHQLLCQIESSRDPQVFPGDIPSIIPVGSVFGESIGDPSGSTSDNPTKEPSPVTIINPDSDTGETTTKYTSHVPKKLKSDKPRFFKWNIKVDIQHVIPEPCQLKIQV